VAFRKFIGELTISVLRLSEPHWNSILFSFPCSSLAEVTRNSKKSGRLRTFGEGRMKNFLILLDGRLCSPSEWMQAVSRFCRRPDTSVSISFAIP